MTESPELSAFVGGSNKIVGRAVQVEIRVESACIY
jgi:hypothetical protein